MRDWNKQKDDLEGNLHATLGFIALNSADYPKAVEHYEAALKSIPKDGIAHFRLGLAYQFLTSDASKAVVNAIKAENDAKTARADQVQIDELVATRQGIEQDLNDKRDKAIDQLATAVAIGGVVAEPARDALTKLYQSKTPDGSTAGLEELITQKKSSAVRVETANCARCTNFKFGVNQRNSRPGSSVTITLSRKLDSRPVEFILNPPFPFPRDIGLLQRRRLHDCTNRHTAVVELFHTEQRRLVENLMRHILSQPLTDPVEHLENIGKVFFERDRHVDDSSRPFLRHHGDGVECFRSE